jgi:hypothetical protein
MTEDMTDRMSEDFPVTKRINYMVGITRSKVFFFLQSAQFLANDHRRVNRVASDKKPGPHSNPKRYNSIILQYFNNIQNPLVN